MSRKRKKYDAIIIGGGMFGLYAAHILSLKKARVAVLEKEKEILERASKINQARVHKGYHYPRSIETAQKTAACYYRFCNDFKFAMLSPFRQYYAISKKNSKTSADEYVKFCKKVGIPLREVGGSLFFQKSKIEAVFETEEACFNHAKLKEYFLNQFANNKCVDIYYQTFPISQSISKSEYVLTLNSYSFQLQSPLVVNATYSNVNIVNELFGFQGYEIKYELCELKLCKMRAGFVGIGLTVMDGPFFSFMPFGDGSIYSLSAVNFTPISTSYTRPQDLEGLKGRHNSDQAEVLAKSYLKKDIEFEYIRSIYEVKPILISSEEDDSRPTLITVHSRSPYFVSVLAGKISTIYDLEDHLNRLIDNIGLNQA
jgi:hypothetical protein